MQAKWISVADAIKALADLHYLTNRYGNDEVCQNVAEETIMGRLKAGVLPTMASFVQFMPGVEDTHFLDEIRNEAVPSAFWSRWLGADQMRRDADWLAGDFKYDSTNPKDWGEPDWGHAFDVRVDANALPWMASVADPVASPAIEAPVEEGKRGPGAPAQYDAAAALAYLAALAHTSANGLCEPSQSEPSERGIARLLEPWCESTFGPNAGPQEGWRRQIGKRVLNEILAQEPRKSAGGTNWLAG